MEAFNQISKDPPVGRVFYAIEMRVPGDAHTQVVVVVVLGVIVVDVPAVAVEIADVDAVAIRGESCLLSSKASKA